MSQYETSVQIPAFRGMNQTGDGYSMSMQYAREMENVNVKGGSFRPMRSGRLLPQILDHPIGTLAYLHRRYGTDTGTLLVAISDGRVFTKLLDGDDAWVQRYPEEGGTPLADSDCDWVTYEVNTRGGESLEAPVDVLLFSNATDGMFCLYGDNQSVVAVTTPENFGVLARYNERIWGSGITAQPDKLMYSAPYDPFDWEQNAEIPEDGAGDILQPTWDGDSFLALRQFGNSLLAIKRNSVWRIYGTNPGEFTMQQQYGGGTIEENTLAVYNDSAYMLGEYGLLQYNGTGAFPFLQDAAQIIMREQATRELDPDRYPSYDSSKLYFPGDRCTYAEVRYRCKRSTGEDSFDSTAWDTVDENPLHNACAAMWNGVYCLALPIGGSDKCNAVLQYDTADRTLALRTEISVDSFLQINERLFYTSADYPGAVYEMDDDAGETKFAKWVSGYQDLGVKSSIKSAFILYMMVDSEVPVELRLGIRTEKKLKQKTVTTKPGKLTRVHLNTQGRVFRLEIQSYTAAPFTISGGIKIDLELDPD